MYAQTAPAFAIFDDFRPIVWVDVLVRCGLLAAFFFVLHYRIEHDWT